MFSASNKIRFMSVITLFVMLFSFTSVRSTLAEGTPGSLDPTFGIDGKIVVDFGGDEDGSILAVDAVGRFLLAGVAGYDEYDFGVARLNPDGTPDMTFGTGGYTTIDFGGEDRVYAITTDEFGHILVSGFIRKRIQTMPWMPPQYEYEAAIARLNDDGTLDLSFGDGGMVTIGVPGRNNTETFAMKIDALGRILLAGSSRVLVYSTEDYEVYNSDIAVVRLNSNGAIDESFGEYGWSLIDLGNDEWASDLALDEMGRIVIAAGSDTWSDNEWVSSHFLVTRLNSNGTLDTGFGQDGQAIFDFGGYNYPNAIALDKTGRIVATGNKSNYDDSNVDLAMARWNSDGLPDMTFGTDGHATIDFGGMDILNRFVLDEAGHIIITGYTGDDVNFDFAIAQLNDDGTLDTNFDGDGFATIDFGGYDYSSAITLDGADHILLAGVTDVNGTLDFALARLNASPTTMPMSIKGFYKPVDMDGVWNTVKGGSTVPLQFEVFDGEDEITDVSVIDQPLQATQALCDGGPSDTVEVVSTGGTSLRYDETLGQFVYNWKTPKKPGYCYVVTVTLEDGASLSANFKLK